MTEQLQRSREWLLFNAVEAWLHHYGTVDRPVVAQYKQLRDEFHDAYMATITIKDAEEPTPPAPKSPRKRTNNGSQSSAKTV